MMPTELIWAVPLAPLAGAILNGLFLSSLPPARKKQVCGLVAVAASSLAFLAAVLIAFGAPRILAGQPFFHDVYGPNWIDLSSADSALTVPYALRIDWLSVTMMLVVTGVGTLIHVFSLGYMADDARYGRYFTYLNLFMFAMLILVL